MIPRYEVVLNDSEMPERLGRCRACKAIGPLGNVCTSRACALRGRPEQPQRLKEFNSPEGQAERARIIQWLGERIARLNALGDKALPHSDLKHFLYVEANALAMAAKDLAAGKEP